MGVCKDCGQYAGWFNDVCAECREENRQSQSRDTESPREVEAKARHEAMDAATKGVVVTTAPSLEGTRIVQTLDIVTAECVFGMNIFRDLFSGISDIFGGRNKSSQKVLRDARITCLNELRREAAMLGANAVIAVDLDYSEFSGGGKSMLFLVASGTAVKVEENN